MGIGVTVARLILDQLVKVRILDPQFSFLARINSTESRGIAMPRVLFLERLVAAKSLL